MISPYHPVNNNVENILQRIVPLSTFVGGFPFASGGYNDGTGYYFAKDTAGGLIVLDTWKRGGDRTNSNMVIMGVAGVGKSTAIKHIALAEFMIGTKIIFIDPEREYKELCENLGGDWINAGGGRGGMFESPPDSSRLLWMMRTKRNKLYQDEGNGMGDMALYMKSLEIFFSLYIPSLQDMQKAVLKDCLIELYNQFHIFWEDLMYRNWNRMRFPHLPTYTRSSSKR